VAHLQIDFEGGVSANIHVSWLEPAKVRRLTLVGDRRMVVYNDLAVRDKIRLYDDRVETCTSALTGEREIHYHRGQVTVPHVEAREPLARLCEHFVDCVARGVTPRTDVVQGLVVVAVLEAAAYSLQAGGRREPVEAVPLPPRRREADARVGPSPTVTVVSLTGRNGHAHPPGGDEAPLAGGELSVNGT
jgi:predicted dehydrogenase